MTRHRARGSAAIEAVIGLPAFALFVGLIICGGRYANAHQSLQSAAAEAARTASVARDAHTAVVEATEAATSSITNQGLPCGQVDVDVDTGDFTKQAGQPGTVTVIVTCVLALSDLAVPGTPGARTLSATMSSPLDTWRQKADQQRADP